MLEKIEIKNKTNWLLAIVLPFALIVLFAVLAILLPLFSLRKYFLLSIFTYLISAVIPFAFFTFLLYVWLWNTFGKTVLEISPNKMCVRQKNKLFSKSKTYLKSEIQEVTILDLSIERTRFLIRPNYLFSNSNQSIVVTTNINRQDRIVDWLTIAQANDLLNKIKPTLQIRQHITTGLS